MRVVPKPLRHKIYKSALTVYLYAREVQNLNIGLCFALNQAVKEFKDAEEVDVYVTTNMFPEIHKYCPDEIGGYWWDTNDKEIRVKVLTEAINDTKRVKTETKT